MRVSSLRPLHLLGAFLCVTFPLSAQASPEHRCLSLRDERPCALSQGERAPYTGELWPSAFALVVLEERTLGLLAMAERDAMSRALAAEKALRAIDQQEAKALLEAQTKARLKSEELARQMVRAPPWYERPAFLIPATAVLTLGLVIGLYTATD